MALSQPRTIFGVHSVTPYSRVDGKPYGEARVVQGSEFKLEGDLIELKGGSNKYSWAIEDGDSSAELAFTVSEYPNWLFELFGGKAPTQGSAETSGNVSALTDKKGTTVVGATGLLATISVDDADDLKMGKYVVVATGAATADVYALSDIDFNRGTIGQFVDDSLKIASLTGIGSGSTHPVAGFGIEFTAGASAGAMTAGDSATFEVRPINTFNRQVKIGGIADSNPEFGCLVYCQKSASRAIFEVDVFKMKASGLGLGAERKQFGENEYTALASYDSAQDGLCMIREIE